MIRPCVSRPAPPSFMALCPSEPASMWLETWTPEQVSTTSGSFAAVLGRGSAPDPCYPAISPKQRAQPCASPTVDCSACSGARTCSGSECDPVDATLHFCILLLSTCCTSGFGDFKNTKVLYWLELRVVTLSSRAYTRMRHRIKVHIFYIIGLMAFFINL